MSFDFGFQVAGCKCRCGAPARRFHVSFIDKNWQHPRMQMGIPLCESCGKVLWDLLRETWCGPDTAPNDRTDTIEPQESDPHISSRNLTHNVNRIVDACLKKAGVTPQIEGRADVGHYEKEGGYSWACCAGRTAAELRPVFEVALAEAFSKEREPDFLKLQPDNGWGTLESVREALKWAAEAAREAPDGAIWWANG